MREIIPREIEIENVDIWFQDEARVGQRGTLTRTWAKKGTRRRLMRPISIPSNAWIQQVPLVEVYGTQPTTSLAVPCWPFRVQEQVFCKKIHAFVVSFSDHEWCQTPLLHMPRYL